MSGHITQRTLAPDEVAKAVQWAADEGWNPGLHDASTFLAADGSAFLGTWLDGDLAAVISAARFGDGHGFIGFYICRPDLRGRGLGLRTWERAVDRLADCATVGLDGVVAEQDNYRKSGFVLIHRNVRYSGVPSLPAVDDDVVEAIPGELAVYDAAINGHRRDAYFDAWIGQPGARRRVAVRDGRVAGYGMMRPCRDGHKVGPLFADDAGLAQSILTALVADADGPISLDVPEPNASAVALAVSVGLAPVFETARMYRGPVPAMDVDRTFGVMSFEFG